MVVSTKSFFEKVAQDDIVGLAASLAFYTILAISPLIVLMITLLSSLKLSLQEQLILQVQELMGAEASSVLTTIIAHSAATSTNQDILKALAKKPRFDIDFSLVKFHPKTINGMLLTYLPLDLTSGELSIYSEVASTKGEVAGYVNVFLKDVDVIAPDQKIKSPRREGKLDIDTNTAFWSSIENNREALPPGFDNSISLKNLEGTLK